MANGELLQDDAMTVAYNKAPLGTRLTIFNSKTNKSADVIVTDRGGFEELGRIIDITLAVKNKLNCSDLCKVRIQEEL